LIGFERRAAFGKVGVHRGATRRIYDAIQVKWRGVREEKGNPKRLLSDRLVRRKYPNRGGMREKVLELTGKISLQRNRNKCSRKKSANVSSR